MAGPGGGAGGGARGAAPSGAAEGGDPAVTGCSPTRHGSRRRRGTPGQRLPDRRGGGTGSGRGHHLTGASGMPRTGSRRVDFSLSAGLGTSTMPAPPTVGRRSAERSWYGWIRGRLVGPVCSRWPVIGVIACPLVVVGLVPPIPGIVRANRGQADDKGPAVAGAALSAVRPAPCVRWVVAVDDAGERVRALSSSALVRRSSPERSGAAGGSDPGGARWPAARCGGHRIPVAGAQAQGFSPERSGRTPSVSGTNPPRSTSDSS